jgi:MinD-like ATPase involved in chromosome partitioning or flagellar assembly
LKCEPGERVCARKLVAGKRELPELIVHTGYDKLDVLPADFSYRNFDVHLSERKKPTERLLRMSRPLGELYGTLFLDCPPGISLSSENVLRAADGVVVHRGAVFERDRKDDSAQGAAACVLAAQCRRAGLRGTVGGGRGAHGRGMSVG